MYTVITITSNEHYVNDQYLKYFAVEKVKFLCAFSCWSWKRRVNSVCTNINQIFTHFSYQCIMYLDKYWLFLDKVNFPKLLYNKNPTWAHVALPKLWTTFLTGKTQVMAFRYFPALPPHFQNRAVVNGGIISFQGN